jgi:hypothetical protein
MTVTGARRCCSTRPRNIQTRRRRPSIPSRGSPPPLLPAHRPCTRLLARPPPRRRLRSEAKQTCRCSKDNAISVRLHLTACPVPPSTPIRTACSVRGVWPSLPLDTTSHSTTCSALTCRSQQPPKACSCAARRAIANFPVCLVAVSRLFFIYFIFRRSDCLSTLAWLMFFNGGPLIREHHMASVDLDLLAY